MWRWKKGREIETGGKKEFSGSILMFFWFFFWGDSFGILFLFNSLPYTSHPTLSLALFLLVYLFPAWYTLIRPLFLEYSLMSIILSA